MGGVNAPWASQGSQSVDVTCVFSSTIQELYHEYTCTMETTAVGLTASLVFSEVREWMPKGPLAWLLAVLCWRAKSELSPLFPVHLHVYYILDKSCIVEFHIIIICIRFCTFVRWVLYLELPSPALSIIIIYSICGQSYMTVVSSWTSFGSTIQCVDTIIAFMAEVVGIPVDSGFPVLSTRGLLVKKLQFYYLKIRRGDNNFNMAISRTSWSDMWTTLLTM